MSAVEIIASVLIGAGLLLGALSAIGLNRFDGVLMRIHAASKPQVLGLLERDRGLLEQFEDGEETPDDDEVVLRVRDELRERQLTTASQLARHDARLLTHADLHGVQVVDVDARRRLGRQRPRGDGRELLGRHRHDELRQ